MGARTPAMAFSRSGPSPLGYGRQRQRLDEDWQALRQLPDALSRCRLEPGDPRYARNEGIPIPVTIP